VLLSAHVLAALMVLPLTLPRSVSLVLLGLVGFSLLFSLARQQPLLVLHLGALGELEIETKVGAGGTARQTATIQPHTTLLPGLMILLLQSGGKRFVLTLLPDALGADNNRQLRLWLQWRAQITTSV
jgi:hypothetical protein